MAGKYGASDLGSDWITVPRKFRGRKPTSSDTELAYITRPEMKALGLLSQAKKMQVGPSNIPSYDDRGFDYDEDTGKLNKWTGTLGGTKTKTPTYQVQGSSTKYTKPTASTGPGFGVLSRSDRGWKPTGEAKPLSEQQNIFGKHVDKTKDSGSFISRDWDRGGDDEDNRTGGDTKTTSLTCAQKGMVDDGMGGCKKKDGTETGDDKCKGVTVPSCPEDKPNGNPKCVDGKIDYSDCTADPNNKTCEYGKDDNGNCKTKPDSGDDSGTPSLTTILQPDETPDLQILTDEMDLRNMLSNVLNKNNPLFKQARTRAFQAMAARGIVNSSMAEEAVMSAVMNVAMPIAQRVITDLQEVMKANVNKRNEYKMALNNMYYQELLRRVDAANTWNLERMKSQQVNWQTVLGAKVEGMGIKDDPAYERYMSMLSKLGSQPSWNVAG